MPLTDRFYNISKKQSVLLVALEKYVRLLCGFFVTAVIARVLGTEGFGVLSYSLSIVFLLNSIASFGLEGVVPREIVNAEERRGRIISAAITIRVLFGVLAVSIGLLYGLWFLEQGELQNVLILLCFLSLFQSHNLIQVCLNSSFENFFSVAFVMLLQLSFFGGKLAYCYIGISVEDFALILLLENSMQFFVLTWYLYRRNYIELHWIDLKKDVVALGKSAAPMVLSGLIITLYNRLDQIMIFNMLGAEQSGQYASAARLAEGVGYVMSIAVTSVFPLVVDVVKDKNSSEYFKKYFRFVFFLLLALSVGVGFFSGVLIDLVYGTQFEQAKTVLPLMLYSVMFSCIGVIATQWLVVEHKQIYRLHRSVIGLSLNVVLNFILIPYYGILGGAIATLVSQIFSAYISNLLIPKIRFIFKIQTEAFLGIKLNERCSS